MIRNVERKASFCEMFRVATNMTRICRRAASAPTDCLVSDRISLFRFKSAQNPCVVVFCRVVSRIIAHCQGFRDGFFF